MLHLPMAASEIALPTLPIDKEMAADGRSLFHLRWRTGPSVGNNRGGLGPLLNARSCVACHIDNGRGRPPEIGKDDPSFLLHLSVAPRNERERKALALDQRPVIGEPNYGTQLQEKATSGEIAEGQTRVTYRDKMFRFDDGEVVMLRRPVYQIVNPGYGPLDEHVEISPRIAQPLAGLGYLAAISDAVILANADANDRDNDGISGRANRVRDLVSGNMALGRFGWKATQPSLLQQSAAAFAGDIGITSELFPPKDGGPVEISLNGLQQVVAYLQNLSAPQSVRVDTEGKALFNRLGCGKCHVPAFQIDIPAQSGTTIKVTIEPYSDLLRHDMGAGLADHRAVAGASGWEWRTQPLWGMRKLIANNGTLLHDGRARNVNEAILWHAGEARQARADYSKLDRKARKALIEFVNSL